MSFKRFDSKMAGSRKETHEPRLFGSIISEMLQGDSPLAVGYRKYLECCVRNDEDLVPIMDRLF